MFAPSTEAPIDKILLALSYRMAVALSAKEVSVLFDHIVAIKKHLGAASGPPTVSTLLATQSDAFTASQNG